MTARVRHRVRWIWEAIRWGDLFLGMAIGEAAAIAALLLWAATPR